MKPIFIIGAGGFGREIAWTIERINAVKPTWELLGFADDAPLRQTGTLAGFPLLGNVAKASREYAGAAVFIAIGANATREKVYRELSGHAFPAIIDPSAEVAPSAELNAGVFAGPRSIVSVNAKLGNFAIVNARAGIGHDCTLEDFSQICPGATLSGNTTVGRHALVGSNACTVPGIIIGDRAQIAAGLPVYRNVASDTTLSPFGIFKNRQP